MSKPRVNTNLPIDPIIKTIKKRRVRLGWSQSEVARRAKTTQSAISEMEMGKGSPLLSTLRKVQDILGLEMTSTTEHLDEIEFLRSLRGQALEDEVMRRRWYVQPNDLIGGWSIMPIDQPPSSGCFEVGECISLLVAQHIVDLHNVILGISHEKGWVPSTSDNSQEVQVHGEERGSLLLGVSTEGQF